jgi:alkaline phosphatase D
MLALMMATPWVAAEAQSREPPSAETPSRGMPSGDAATGQIRIGLASCIAHWRARPALRHAASRNPSAFLFLGDNIYADTTDPEVMRSGYARLAAGEAFQQLREQAEVFAVWDDHDYGRNDAGRNFPFREGAERIFEEFWRLPPEDPRRERPGIYGVERISAGGMDVQLILLDTRFFRSPLRRLPADAAQTVDGPYARTPSPSATILGSAQWDWLTELLQGPKADPPDLRIIASSIQVLAEYHGWESWSNFPREQERLLALIRDNLTIPTLIVSGDRHFSELSSREVMGMRLVDVTASSVNIAYPEDEPTENDHRVGGYFLEPNTTDLLLRAGEEPTVTVRTFDADGTVVLRYEISWDNDRGWLFER